MAAADASGQTDAAAGVGSKAAVRQKISGALNAAGGGAVESWVWKVSSGWIKGQAAPVPDACAVHAFSVTPSDATVFDPPCRWLWIGTEGDVALTTLDGCQVLLSGVPGGTRLPVACLQVLAATTAQDIVACW